MNENLPIPIPDDGFGADSDVDRLIQGGRIHCDVTKSPSWLAQPGSVPVDTTRERLVMTSRTANRRWEDDRVVEEIVKVKGEPFPSADTLNEAIPKARWRDGPNGLQGPWQLTMFVMMLDVQSGERCTFVTTSIGGRIAVTELRDDIAWMRRLRGADVAPVVLLDLKPFPTRYGVKSRPWLRPTRWVVLGGGELATLPEPTPKLLPGAEEKRAAGLNPDSGGGGRVKLKDVKPVTTSEAIGDELPPWDDDISDVGRS
jgi:hypothetical protein